MTDVEQFQAALAPIVDLMKRIQRDAEEGVQAFGQVLNRALRDARTATQEDFALVPPQPACPSVGDPKSSQVNASPIVNTLGD